MNIETMKSVILVILIGFSMVLSLALWNYQPDVDPVQNDNVIEETKLEEVGAETTIANLVEPVQYVFHEQGLHYSYKNQNDRTSMYRNMKEWPLLNLEKNPGNRPELNNQQEIAEIIFPAELPVKVLEDIFKIENVQLVESQVFDRILVVQDPEGGSTAPYTLWIIDSNEEVDPVKLRASVSQSVGTQLFRTLDDKENLIEQIPVAGLETADEPAKSYDQIYIPKGKVSYPEEVLQTNAIPVKPLQNELFPPNSYVSEYTTNSGDRRLFSTYRRLDILDDQMNFVYMIPNEASPSYWSSYELLTKSLNDINKHLGWTNTFRMDTLSGSQDQVSYRMYFNDIPIHESPDEVALMSLSYEQGNIQEYSRPLIQFERYPGGEDTSEELIAGQDVVEFLRKTDRYDMERIDDIKVGYSLVEEDNSLAYYLLPRWFVKQSGTWNLLKTDELSQNEDIS